MNTLFFGFINFSKHFCEYIRMENKDYKNKDIGRKYLQNMRNSQILKVKNSLLKLQIFFYGFERQRIERQKRKN